MVEKALPESGTVTVACKLPNGLILRLFNMIDRDEVVMGGGVRSIKQAVLAGEPVEIKGCAAPFGEPILLFGGYAMTRNVDAQFFAEWMKQNADSDMVKNRLIFAAEKPDYAADDAKENKSRLSGLQPLVPDKDERAPSRIKTAKLTEDA